VVEIIRKYFPEIVTSSFKQFSELKNVYQAWNSRINVISRKDFDNFYVHHVLHSLSIAKIIGFEPGTRILDVGTGGGFPGIPLAIIFPEADFYLLDSIEKKIKVVRAVVEETGLHNVTVLRERAEDEKGKYDFVVSRAVTEFPAFVKLTEKNINKGGINRLKNGIISLKGGDLSEELGDLMARSTIWNISDFFEESYFETKKIVYLPS
jgi:16S rRNA (guanine527-N7)-methyltransferase